MLLFGVRLSVCPSVCMSVPSGVCTPLLQVCCCGPGWAETIDRLLQQRRANAGSATLSAYVGS